MEPQPRSNNLALSLTALGRHDEAVPLLRMTLDAQGRDAELGVDHRGWAGDGRGKKWMGWEMLKTKTWPKT